MITKEIYVQYNRQALVDYINEQRLMAMTIRSEYNKYETHARNMLTARIRAFDDMAIILGLGEYIEDLPQ